MESITLLYYIQYTYYHGFSSQPSSKINGFDVRPSICKCIFAKIGSGSKLYLASNNNDFESKNTAAAAVGS